MSNRINGVSNFGGAGTLFGAYFKQIAQERGGGAARRALADVGNVNTSLDGLKSKLLQLASKLERFRDSNSALAGIARAATELSGGDLTTSSQVSLAEDDAPPPPGAPNPIRVSLQNGDKPGQFEAQIMRRLSHGFSSTDDKLLPSYKYSGDVHFEIGSGEDAESFSIHVDASTTVESFIDEFNSKANGKATASAVNLGSESDPRYRIKIETTAPSQPPVETEGTDPAQSTSPASTVSILLGGGGPGRSEFAGDPAALAGELKSFVDAFNSLVQYVKKEGGSNLHDTQVDEALLSSFKDAFTTTKSNDGRIAFEDLIKQRGGGTIAVDLNRMEELVAEDPTAVVEVLKNFAITVGGSNGMVREYTVRGGKLDEALGAVQYKIAQQAVTELQTASGEEVKSGETAASRATSSERAMQEGAGYLSTVLKQ